MPWRACRGTLATAAGGIAQGVIEGLLVNSYRNMVLNEDAAAAGFRLLAQQVWLSLPKRDTPGTDGGGWFAAL